MRTTLVVAHREVLRVRAEPHAQGIPQHAHGMSRGEILVRIVRPPCARVNEADRIFLPLGAHGEQCER